MKKIALPILVAVFFATLAFGQTRSPQPNIPQIEVAPKKELKGPERQKAFFNLLNYPNKTQTPEQIERLWQKIDAMPSDVSENAESRSTVADWEYIGDQPGYGSSTNFTGRIVDIEVFDSIFNMRILSASGGLWQLGWNFGEKKCLSNKLNSGNGGAFATHPTNDDIIFLGTGEPRIAAGTGLWKTENGGKSWSKVTLSPAPTTFYKIAFDPSNNNRIWVASNTGLYVSTNGGATFAKKRAGDVTDFAFKSGTPAHLFCSVWGDKFYKSTNSGAIWTAMTTGGVPTTNIGRTEMEICSVDNNIIYALAARNDNNNLLGIYKSIDGGVNWTTCSSPELFSGQGFYDVALAISPGDCNLVLAGGVSLMRSTDGTNFTAVPDGGQHADHHSIAFVAPGSTDVLLGNDGGFMSSGDDGATWTKAFNTLPISQFYNFSNGKSDHKRFIGGTQDNGGIFTKGVNYDWSTTGGDSWGSAVDPFNGNNIFYTGGIFGAPIPTRPIRSTDGGVNFSIIDNGILPAAQWQTQFRTDHVAPVYLYNTHDGYVYESVNNGTNWAVLNAGGTPFPANIQNVMVGQGFPQNIYVSLMAPNNQVWVRDRTTISWINRSAGLPTTGAAGTFVYKISTSPNPAEPDVAYAVMGGKPSGAIKKVYKTINRGATWVNITGNLPNVACTDLVQYPNDQNVLVLATDIGAFRTDDGGQTWVHWWEGLARQITMTELDYIDSININGKFYITASTFGRGLWKREIGHSETFQSGDDRAAKIEPAEAMPAFILGQNMTYLGISDRTAIPYYNDAEADVRISLFNENGNLVKILVDEKSQKGMHQVDLETGGLASGVYFYSMEAANFKATKKMVVVR